MESETVRLVAGEIVIRVSVDNLPAIVEGGWASRVFPIRFKVTDPEAFAADLLYELRREEEDGTTPIHRLFDRCIWSAIENGAQGIARDQNDAP
jgi:hypothetical protein